MNRQEQQHQILLNLQALPPVLTPRLITRAVIRSGLSSGTLTRIQPERFVRTQDLPSAKDHQYRQAEAQARLNLSAGMTKLHRDEALSHHSAALLLGFPWLGQDLNVHTIRTGAKRQARRGFTLHTYKLDPSRVLSVNGISVTDMAQTAIDLASTLPPPLGLAALDHARRTGVDQTLLRDLARIRYGKGSANTRRLVEVCVADAESVRESMCRYWLHKAGVAEVLTQVHIQTPLGRYRVDMLIKGTKLIVEYDGEDKYRANGNALLQEKAREDALRAEGWDFLRVSRLTMSRVDVFLAEVQRRLAAHDYILLNQKKVLVP